MTVTLDGVQAGSLTAAQVASPWTTVTFTKPDVTVAGSSGAWTTANTGLTVFTITGVVRIRCFGVVSTNFTSTGSTGTILLEGAGTGTNDFLANAATANGTNLQQNYIWGNNGATGNPTPPNSSGNFQIMSTGSVILTIGTNNMTAGGMTIYCDWIAVTAGATVTAATP